jgi:hypothetical protein
MTKVKIHRVKRQLVAKATVLQPGSMRGKIRIKKNFDAPLPKELLDAFAGKS